MKSNILAGASALALGACAYTPSPLPVTLAQTAPADPTIISKMTYGDPLAGYTYRGPTGPRDWREVNQEQTEGN